MGQARKVSLKDLMCYMDVSGQFGAGGFILTKKYINYPTSIDRGAL